MKRFTLFLLCGLAFVASGCDNHSLRIKNQKLREESDAARTRYEREILDLRREISELNRSFLLRKNSQIKMESPHHLSKILSQACSSLAWKVGSECRQIGLFKRSDVSVDVLRSTARNEESIFDLLEERPPTSEEVYDCIEEKLAEQL